MFTIVYSVKSRYREIVTTQIIIIKLPVKYVTNVLTLYISISMSCRRLAQKVYFNWQTREILS